MGRFLPGIERQADRGYRRIEGRDGNLRADDHRAVLVDLLVTEAEQARGIGGIDQSEEDSPMMAGGE